MDERVIFLGQRQDVPEILKGADVLVLPSLYEGLPLAILEGMTASLPVVATRVGGVPELVAGPARDALAAVGKMLAETNA